MKATSTTATATVDISQQAVAQQAAQVGIGVIALFTGLSGIWGAACLLSALSQYGVTGLIKGWISAVLGG
ncbi:MAG: hypothetical protein ACOY32_01080 [Thermodesulfobacteriota bacterium]